MTASRESARPGRALEPSDIALAAFLARVRRRLAWLAALRAAAVGLVAAVVPLACGAFGLCSPRVALMLAGFAALGTAMIWRWRLGAVGPAREVEHRAPALRNVLITAAELHADAIAAPPAMVALVTMAAACAVEPLEPRVLFPATRRVLECAAALVAAAVGVALVASGTHIALLSPSRMPAVGIIDVRVEPPAYTHLPAASAQNPDQVGALEGSRVFLSVSSSAAAMTMESVDANDEASDAATTRRTPLMPDGRGHFTVTLTAARDGYLAFQPADAAGRYGVRRLLPLRVSPDRPPDVQIDSPAKDLVVTDPSRAIPLHVAARDDLGLTTLSIRYTKVSGSGEDFTFTEGELPLTLVSKDARAWSGRSTLVPASLGLAAGDMVVYRALAGDARPGASPAESDAFVVQIARPNDVPADGFAMDDTPDRYKLSQQMIIVKTEQLIAKRSMLASEAFADQAAVIAAEQRKVRAEFVFMMGGELSEDELNIADDPTLLHEDTEAMGEADLMAGRLLNQGRRDMILAIRRMADAASTLGMPPPDVTGALKLERAALDSLQRAFTKSRYLLRTIPIRERIDDARRLSGSLAGLLPWRRGAAEVPVDLRLVALRRALTAVMACAAHVTFGPGDAANTSLAAEAILRAAPSVPALQQVSARLNGAAADLAAGRTPPQLRAWLADAAVELSHAAAAELPAGSMAAADPVISRMSGALADALRIRRQP